MTTKYNINEVILRSLHIARESGVPIFFISNPGFGKTTMLYKYATMMDYNLVLLRGADYQPEDILGFPVDHDKVFERLLPDWLKLMSTEKPNILFIDELTTANDFTQSALLSVIFERKVGAVPLPEDTFIVAAGNYHMNLSESFNLIAPIVNRHMFVNLKSSDKDVELFLGLDDTYEMFDPESIVKRQLTPQKSKVLRGIIRDIILYMQKHIGLDLNAVDMVNIYQGQEYIRNATTLRSLAYIARVMESMYVNDMLDDWDMLELFIDGLMGYGIEMNKKDLTPAKVFVEQFKQRDPLTKMEGKDLISEFKLNYDIKPEFYDLTYDDLVDYPVSSVEKFVGAIVVMMVLDETKGNLKNLDVKKNGPLARYVRDIIKDPDRADVLEGKIKPSEFNKIVKTKNNKK